MVNEFTLQDSQIGVFSPRTMMAQALIIKNILRLRLFGRLLRIPPLRLASPWFLANYGPFPKLTLLVIGCPL